MLPWSALVKGENISIKHFNHPPDGLHGSWYGHYKGVLDVPFWDMEQVVNSQPDEAMESISEIKSRPIPRPVVNGIRQVLDWHPEGISLYGLRAELKRNNITMDKDLFGHKKFSHLLSSMPNVLRFLLPASGEGQPLVIGTQRGVSESIDSSSKPAKDIEFSDGYLFHAIILNGKPSAVASPTTISEPSHSCEEIDVNASIGTSTLPQGQEAAVGRGLFKRLWKTFSGSKPPKEQCSPSSKRTNVTVVGASTSQQGIDAAVAAGFFRRDWKTLCDTRCGHSNDKNDMIHEADSTAHDKVAAHSEKAKCKESCNVKE